MQRKALAYRALARTVWICTAPLGVVERTKQHTQRRRDMLTKIKMKKDDKAIIVDLLPNPKMGWEIVQSLIMLGFSRDWEAEHWANIKRDDDES